MNLTRIRQTICTVPRLDMDVMRFDRLDMVIYNNFNDDTIGPESVARLKDKIAISQATKNIEYTDQQIQQFVGCWNNAKGRPLAPYANTWYGTLIFSAVKNMGTDITLLNAPDGNELFVELTPEICAGMIDYLTYQMEHSDIASKLQEYQNSMAIELFDTDDVIDSQQEYSDLEDIIRCLKKVQKSNFNKKMSYIVFS